jgi:hypothetical protein
MSEKMAPAAAPTVQAAAVPAQEGYAAAGDIAHSGEQAPPVAAARGRKLIRDGEVELQVRDLEAARVKLEEMTRTANGFVSDVRYDKYTSSHELSLTLRLPAEGFGSFVKSLAALGEVLKEQTNTSDVTDQWVDLNQRIATDQKLAARLEEMIQNKSYQFKDLLDVERELARLQLEIEQLQGALRGMDDRIALSTLKVVMRQTVLQKIAPPDSVFAPLLNALENAGPNLKSSVRALMSFAGGLISLAMALLPWLIVLAAIFAVLALAIKRRKPKAK